VEAMQQRLLPRSFSIVDKTNEAENCLQIKVHDAK
jgi:hypothetical protein